MFSEAVVTDMRVVFLYISYVVIRIILATVLTVSVIVKTLVAYIVVIIYSCYFIVRIILATVVTLRIMAT